MIGQGSTKAYIVIDQGNTLAFMHHIRSTLRHASMIYLGKTKAYIHDRSRKN